MAPAPDSNAMKLVGCKHFQQFNPRTDRFAVHQFHHVEFYCADATNVSRRFAWGLGLTAVKGLVDAHRGKVHVDSSEGKGTTFSIELPRDVRAG